MNLLIYIERILDKLQSILHTLAGWVVGLLLFMADFIVGHELAVGLVVAVTLMDAIWGNLVTYTMQKGTELNKCFDNIAVKGFYIEDVKVISYDLSDHYPIVAKLMLKQN